MTVQAGGVAVIVGAGPGLGMSMARRFGREGYTPVLVSRSAARHGGYLGSLAEDGIDAGSFTADVRDQAQVRSVLAAITGRYGAIDLLYYGPAAVDPAALPKPITQTGPAAVREAMSWVYPAIDIAAQILPAMTGRGSGGLLFTIGALIERGDIHRFVTSQPGQFGETAIASLDPDEIADAARDLYTKRDRPEATFSTPA